MKDSETIEVYNQKVDQYQKLAGSLTPSGSLRRFMRTLPKDGLVLDLGCGPANASAMMRESGYRVDPVDASSEMVRVANETFDIGARMGVFADINQVSFYDGVWANFSLLHAAKSDFPKYLKAIHKSLKSDGVFHLGMKLKTSDDEARDQIGRFYSYYTEPELVEHLNDAGFKISYSSTGAEKGLAGNVDPFILILSVA